MSTNVSRGKKMLSFSNYLRDLIPLLGRSAKQQSKMEYPVPRRSNFTEKVHGYTIMDPYRWMEDGDSEETKQYIDDHNKVADAFLNSEQVAKISALVSKEYPKHTFTEPKFFGAYWWWKQRMVDIESNQETITFVRSKDYNNQNPEVVITMDDYFDSNQSIEFWNVDPVEGRYWVGGVQTNGSDWQSVRIFDADQKKFLEETLENVKFTFRYTFTHDGEGFFYHVLPPSEHDKDGPYGSEMMYYHRLNTCQSDDIKVWSDDSGALYIPGTESITDDGKYLIYTIAEGPAPKEFVFWAEVEQVKQGNHEVHVIDDSFTSIYVYLCTMDDKWVFLTNRGAQNFNIVSWCSKQGFEVVVGEISDMLKAATPVGKDKLLLVYIQEASDRLLMWSKGDVITEFRGGESLSFLTLHGSTKHQDAFAMVQSFDSPLQVYKIDSENALLGKLASEKELDSASDDFVCERHHYKSNDDTEIGMFVSYYKSKRTEKNPPVLLYAYGGFAEPEEPRYDTLWSTFMKQYGGVLCVANIRGGGENGQSWWEAAANGKRQVSFDDFKAAARYIVDNAGITTVDKLAINGMSNGGLLTGACTVQDPQLFGAVICDVGIHDFPRFDQFTFGALWKAEYGDPADEETYLKLLKMSPYANITEQEYPPMMVTTADHDDRVVPAHSLKFVAELLHRNPNNSNPIILRVHKGTGHMLGKSASMTIHEAAEKLDFLQQTLKIDVEL